MRLVHKLEELINSRVPLLLETKQAHQHKVRAQLLSDKMPQDQINSQQQLRLVLLRDNLHKEQTPLRLVLALVRQIKEQAVLRLGIKQDSRGLILPEIALLLV